MSDKLIDISENVGLWVNANGKYGIQSGGRETTITDAEFNRLAMEAPLFKEVVVALKNAHLFRDTTPYGETYQICPFCDNILPITTDHCDMIDCPREKILAEIAELEKPG